MKHNIAILVVDDEVDIRTALSKILLKEGYAFDSAADGQEALVKLEQGDFHLVLTDVKMPRLNGFELIKMIKRDYPHIGVIVMTAYGDSYTVKDALLLGADEYITKPFKSFEVNLVVERAYWRLMAARGESR